MLTSTKTSTPADAAGEAQTVICSISPLAREPPTARTLAHQCEITNALGGAVGFGDYEHPPAFDARRKRHSHRRYAAHRGTRVSR
ncbi:hypothetical protein PsYK624_065590 [Phanerochaete sordida]|uniref:Uncharacterized protein n=1 Tax=Phanerochaete sordida TaxID=48140 RepID=A0A9P3G8V3_9APHY|nr:hypothetical protein PsYK624_065590 [Phanerochaete sordida]